MKVWIFYNAKLGTCKRLTEEQMREFKEFYSIEFPAWDDYWQCHDENSLQNARGDMFLWLRDVPITLDLKRYNSVDYSLGGVVRITDDTEYGKGHFAIFIFERKVFYTDAFEYVRCRETGEYFIKDGKWVAKSELKEEKSEVEE